MADTGLFTRLKRLFSTDVVIRNEGDNQLKVFDINKIQVSGEYETNALVDRFNRIYTNSHTSIYGYQSSFNYQTLRPTLYSEYDSMDTDAIIASALDIIADESTLRNDMGDLYHIHLVFRYGRHCKGLHYIHQIFQQFLILRKNHHISTYYESKAIS